MEDNIQAQILKPFIDKMEREWQALYDKVVSSPSEEALELKPVISEHLHQVKLLQSATPGVDSSDQVHEFLRKSKIDFRTVERRWQRHLVSGERVKTRLENQKKKFST